MPLTFQYTSLKSAAFSDTCLWHCGFPVGPAQVDSQLLLAASPQKLMFKIRRILLNALLTSQLSSVRAKLGLPQLAGLGSPFVISSGTELPRGQLHTLMLSSNHSVAPAEKS